MKLINNIVFGALVTSSSVDAWTTIGKTLSSTTSTTITTTTLASSSRRDFIIAAGGLAGIATFTLSNPAFADGEEGGGGDASAPAVQEAPPPAPAPSAPNSADENDFIAKLKAQSDAKRDVYKKQSQSSDKLSLRQFSSQYDRPSCRDDGHIVLRECVWW